jgi:hypothetical protein
MVSIYLHIHHATRRLSVSVASGMPHRQESIDQPEAGQVDEGYFVLALSLIHAYSSYHAKWYDLQGPSVFRA